MENYQPTFKFVHFTGILALITLLFLPRNSEDKNAPNLKVETSKCVSFVVDYSTSVDTLIAKGGYSYVCHRAKSKNFPNERTTGKDTIRGILFRFNKKVPMDSIQKWANDSINIRPATIKELAKLGLENYLPEEDHFVLALGSKTKVEGKMYSPGLDLDDHSFRTNSWTGGKWDNKRDYYLFVYK